MAGGGRPCTYSKCEILDAIFHIVRGGIHWRIIYNDRPHWKTVSHYFSLWTKLVVCQQGYDTPRELSRTDCRKRKPLPLRSSTLQSVRTSSQAGIRVYGAGKRLFVRKRPALVDTHGFGLCISDTEAFVQDQHGASDLLSRALVGGFGWITRSWADGGNSAQLGEEVASLPSHFKGELEAGKSSDPLKGFKVLLERSIVERTFGWLVRRRGPIRDFCVLQEHSVAMIQVAMIKLMLRRIAY